MSTWGFYIGAFLCAVLLSDLQVSLFGDDRIRYVNDRTLDLPVARVEKAVIDIDDEISLDTLYQHLSGSGYPVYYSRNVRTNVCFDGKCRLLDIVLFWNPTGRYLGFEMPEDEYLSKFDHDPFTKEEYIRLNELLADPALPLGNFAYNEIILASEMPQDDVDGVSGATSKDILEYVVEGAAYTTHKLFKTVYGETQRIVQQWTAELSDDTFIGLVLEGANYEDKIWVLGSIRGNLAKYPGVRETVLELIKSDDYSLSEKALNVFVGRDMEDESVQEELMGGFNEFDYGQRNSVIQLLKKAANLFPSTIYMLNSQLSDMEVPLVVETLELYKINRIRDKDTVEAITALSRVENRYLATKAAEYLNLVGGSPD